MIKINLLPVRAAKKKESTVQQIVMFCSGLLMVLALVVVMYLVERAQISDAREEIVSANDKINELKTKIGRIEKLKALKEQVKKKLDVLNQLRKNKTGPAQRLATLSSSTPDQLWLTSYSELGQEIKLSGISYTEELIARFMRSLESSQDYMGVELLVSEQKEIQGNKYKRFDLSCKLRSTTEENQKTK